MVTSPRVWSRRKGAETPPPGAVYVGRGTPWGNPYVVGQDGTHEEVVARFRRMVMDPSYESYRAAIRRALGGRDLVCWCAPLPCHADVLLEVANPERTATGRALSDADFEALADEAESDDA